MQLGRSIWQGTAPGMAALAMLLTCGFSGFADQPPAKKDAPKPLPKEIIEAWKTAGAEIGWIRVDKYGWAYFVPEENGVAGDLAAFRFSVWKQGTLEKLPAPAAAFGLDLGLTQATDTGLKELARLKNLHSLNLAST